MRFVRGGSFCGGVGGRLIGVVVSVLRCKGCLSF